MRGRAKRQRNAESITEKPHCRVCGKLIKRALRTDGSLESVKSYLAREACGRSCAGKLRHKQIDRPTVTGGPLCLCGLEPAIRRVERPQGSGHYVNLGHACLALHREQVAIRRELDTSRRIVDLSVDYGYAGASRNFKWAR